MRLKSIQQLEDLGVTSSLAYLNTSVRKYKYHGDKFVIFA